MPKRFWLFVLVRNIKNVNEQFFNVNEAAYKENKKSIIFS